MTRIRGSETLAGPALWLARQAILLERRPVTDSYDRNPFGELIACGAHLLSGRRSFWHFGIRARPVF
jgi:hypothetical protein